MTKGAVGGSSAPLSPARTREGWPYLPLLPPRSPERLRRVGHLDAGEPPNPLHLDGRDTRRLQPVIELRRLDRPVPVADGPALVVLVEPGAPHVPVCRRQGAAVVDPRA